MARTPIDLKSVGAHAAPVDLMALRTPLSAADAAQALVSAPFSASSSFSAEANVVPSETNEAAPVSAGPNWEPASRRTASALLTPCLILFGNVSAIELA